MMSIHGRLLQLMLLLLLFAILTILWLRGIMKRLFALCNSIIWVFLSFVVDCLGTMIQIWNALNHTHGMYTDIDSDLMPILLKATKYGHI